jgi:hypothetical protein
MQSAMAWLVRELASLAPQNCCSEAPMNGSKAVSHYALDPAVRRLEEAHVGEAALLLPSHGNVRRERKGEQVLRCGTAEIRMCRSAMRRRVWVRTGRVLCLR